MFGVASVPLLLDAFSTNNIIMLSDELSVSNALTFVVNITVGAIPVDYCLDLVDRDRL